MRSARLALAAMLLALAPVVWAQGEVSEARWRELWQSGESSAALEMGEKLVAAGSTPAREVLLRAQLAIHYRTVGRYERASQLITEATTLTSGWRFRALNDGGETGYQRRMALFTLYRAECRMAVGLRDVAEGRALCERSLAEARRVTELARFGRSESAAMNAEIDAQLDFAHLERVAGRHAAARPHLDAAGRLLEQHRGRGGAAAHFLREASAAAQEAGDSPRAVALARQAVALWDQRGSSPTSAAALQARDVLQRALVAAGDWSAALSEFDAMDALVADQRGARPRSNMSARALAYAHGGRLASLAPQLARSAANWEARLGPTHPQTAVMRGLHGAALLAGARNPAERAQARRLLVDASRLLLEAQRAGDAFLEGSLEAQVARFVLEQFLRAQQGGDLGPGEFELAFQVADALRGSKVQAAIQDAALRMAGGNDGPRELVRQTREVQQAIRALEDILSGRTDDDAGAERERLQVLRDERQRLLAQLRTAYPALATLVNPRAPTPEDVVRRLALGELLLLMLPVDDGVHVWSLSWTEQRHRFVALAPGSLAQAVAAVRASTDFSPRLQPYALEPARWLGTQLLGPMEPAIQQARHVVVAAGGVLGSLPFAALPIGQTQPDGEPWLIRRVAVSQVPSASAWLAIQRLALADRPSGALLAWGDPSFDLRAAATPGGGTRRLVSSRAATLDAANVPRYSDLPPLPETRVELLAIAQSVKADAGRDVILGAGATRASVLAANARGELATRRVVAFATHGLMAGDLPDLNQPALALAATPDAESKPLAPLLTLDDVLGLRLNADWVVLSACNTAAADGRAEEALSGLARGFFYAGARSVLVTHWAVETESAMLLTTQTFSHYTANPYAGKAESLRQAMLQVMAMPRYQHPAFWAPYALVGDGAR